MNRFALVPSSIRSAHAATTEQHPGYYRKTQLTKYTQCFQYITLYRVVINCSGLCHVTARGSPCPLQGTGQFILHTLATAPHSSLKMFFNQSITFSYSTPSLSAAAKSTFNCNVYKLIISRWKSPKIYERR